MPLAPPPPISRWRRCLGALALLLPLLSGCQRPPALEASPAAITIWAENLQIDLDSDHTNQADGLEEQIQEYRRVNPGATILLRRFPTAALLQRLEGQAQQGLAPDLLLLRPRHLARLRREGHLRLLRLPPQTRALFRPGLLAMVNDGSSTGTVEAVPYLLYTLLSCYNRQQIRTPPTTLEALLQDAAAGRRLALGGTLEQLQWLQDGFRGQRKPFLHWIQKANLESTVSFVDSEQQLGFGLLHKRFDWIPCSSAWLPTLRQHLGADLGVAPLPATPSGPARPYLRGRVWTFSAQSNGAQRRLADDFALFSTNPVQQRNLSLRLVSGLPVNADLPLPLGGYPELAAMDASLTTSSWLTSRQLDRLLKASERAQPVLNRVITGALSPRDAERQLQALEPQR